MSRLKSTANQSQVYTRPHCWKCINVCAWALCVLPAEHVLHEYFSLGWGWKCSPGCEDTACQCLRCPFRVKGRSRSSDGNIYFFPTRTGFLTIILTKTVRIKRRKKTTKPTHTPKSPAEIYKEKQSQLWKRVKRARAHTLTYTKDRSAANYNDNVICFCILIVLFSLPVIDLVVPTSWEGKWCL